MQKFTRSRVNRFLQRFGTEQRVLDIGSGGVNQAPYFPNRTTFDIDPIRKPQVIGDAHQLPFSDESFEMILCSEVLEHLHSPATAIAEMHRVLVPGGRVILTTRFTYPIHDAPGDFFRYTPFGLRQLFKSWEIDVLEQEADAFSTIGILLQRIIFQTDLKGGRITKLLIYLAADVFLKMDFLLREQFGDIQRHSKQPCILSSGVYGVFRKK